MSYSPRIYKGSFWNKTGASYRALEGQTNPSSIKSPNYFLNSANSIGDIRLEVEIITLIFAPTQFDGQ